VAPSCSGTGTDGKRVQVLYVRDSSTASRYKDVLPLLRNEIANVDDVFALSARQTGGERRVRWVHQDCVPVVTEVVVPAGSLNGNFGDTITALSNLGYRDANRKYLAFTEARSLCGVGTMYDDTRVSGNANDGYAASYARVDAGCWSTRDHSVAAHELTHTLGAVLETAPHATTYGHCSDEADLMCYDDGSGIAMRSVCGAAQEQLLDCNGDDYFNTAPPAGSFLASSWNTARSGFLDTPGASSAPTGGTLTVTAAASRTSAETGDAVSATATSSAATGFRWSVSQPCALTGQTTATVSMVCPSTVGGPVDLVVTASDGNGGTATATATVNLTRAAAPTAAVSVPAQVAEGGTFAASAQVTGKAPFTYRWSASSPCSLPATSTATALGSCAPGSAGQSSTVGLTVTQADGQTVQATPAVLPVVRADTVQGATSWSSPTVSGKDPAVISAVLTEQASGSPLAGAPVELQARSGTGGEWTTAVAGLVTRSDGRVSVERRRSAVASYRFAYAGTADGSSAASLSPEVLVKARTISKAEWHGHKHLVTGRLLTVDGTPLRGVTVTLERRYAGSSRWVAVARATSDQDGRLRATQHPRHTAYFRWSYRGSEQLLPARSASVRVRPQA
jgi:5-hydroxyisourate hydrolase-like protein (transthyretin family)